MLMKWGENHPSKENKKVKKNPRVAWGGGGDKGIRKEEKKPAKEKNKTGGETAHYHSVPPSRGQDESSEKKTKRAKKNPRLRPGGRKKRSKLGTGCKKLIGKTRKKKGQKIGDESPAKKKTE